MRSRGDGREQLVRGRGEKYDIQSMKRLKH